MSYKEETKKSYNKFGHDFADKSADYIKNHLNEEFRIFTEMCSPNAKILDIGSGSGNHALELKELGFDVTCIDISEEMVRLCKEKGLKAEVEDMENMNFPDNSFDGAWIYTSLLHIPKNKLPETLKKIKKIIKPNGVVMLGMKKGKDEGFREQPEYPGTKRWFSLFIDEELRKL